MDLILVNLIDGLVTGLLLFMLSSGLTLIFSMMGVLNFAHASFYMLGAYFAYQISLFLGFWVALLVAPPIVGVLGALVERYGLRRVHKFGHVPELIFTFGLALLIEEVVQFFWGKNQLPFEEPEILDFALFAISGNTIPAYKVFMIFISIAIFIGLLYILTKTRVGLIIQAALTHPNTVETLGHNVPLVFMGVFGVGTALAGVAGVIAGPVLGTFPGMAFLLGSIVFVTIVVGGLGSLPGALVASLLIGWITTFAASYNLEFADVLMAFGMERPADLSESMLADAWTLTLPQIGPILPYILMVLILVFGLRPSWKAFGMTALDQTRTPAMGGVTVARALPWIIAILFLLVMPLIFTANSSLTIMNQMAITIVFALAYNMLLGQGGMLSFGHAVYMGLGGFLCVHLMNYVENFELPIPLPLLPLFGGIFGMIFAMLIGTFSTRNAGTVFAMISLGIGELIAACSIIIVVFFGGEEGISGDRTYGLPVFGIEFIKQIEVYYLTAFWLVLSALAMYLFSRTPVGRMANAVRDNPERAEFLGYSARWVRFYSFIFSGFFAGVAGGLFAINYEILTEENLNLITSGSILLITFLGGVGLFFGPIIGAIAFTLLQTVLSLETELWQLYVGVLFVLTVMFFPGGLAGLLAMHVPAAKLGKLGSLTLPYLKTLVPATVAVLALAALIEMTFHVRHAYEGEHEMGIYWINWDTHSILPWAVFGALAVAGYWLARTFAPEMKEAWDKANTVGD